MPGFVSSALQVTLVTSVHDAAGRWLVPTFVGYAVRGTVVLVVAWLMIACVLRRSAASTRHAVWIAALTVAGLMPALARFTPGIAIHVSVPHAVTPPANIWPGAPFPTAAHVPRPGATVSTRSGLTTAHLEDAAPRATRAATLDLFTWASVIGWIALLWIVGVVALVTRFAVGSLIVWKRTFGAAPVVDPEWSMLVAQIARELRIRRPITVLTDRANTIPATWGTVYPVVLLPRDTSSWPLGRRRAVLLHELAHVARLDALTQLIAHVALAANWFNPLAWVAIARMRDERERACDDVVLNAGTLASTYAAELLALVRTLQPADPSASSPFAIAQHGEMEGRLLAILDPCRKRTALSRRTRFVSVLAAAPCIGILAAAHPVRSGLTSRPASVVTPSSRLVTATPASKRRAPIASTIAHAGLTLDVPTPGGAARSAPIAVSSPHHPAPLPDTTYCPVHTDFARGGVSADSGELGALEAEHDDHRILVVATNGRCPTARIDGEVVLRDDASDVTTLGPAGHLTVADTTSGSRRVAEVDRVARGQDPSRRADVTMANAPRALWVIDGVIIDPDTASSAPRNSSGTLTHRYFVDGQERPWEEGQAWYAATLAELVRETAYHVRGRMARLRQVGGVSAVLAEIRQLRNEHARRDYFDALLDSGALSPDEARRAADLAAATLTASTDRDRIVARLRAPAP